MKVIQEVYPAYYYGIMLATLQLPVEMAFVTHSLQVLLRPCTKRIPERARTFKKTE